MCRALRHWYVNFPRFHGFRGGQHPKVSRGAGERVARGAAVVTVSAFAPLLGVIDLSEPKDEGVRPDFSLGHEPTHPQSSAILD